MAALYAISVVTLALWISVYDILLVIKEGEKMID